MADLKLKEYMFTFEGGGWNTVWAKTRRGAIAEANRQYKNEETLNVREGSVHLATKEGLRAACSLFY